MNAHHGFALGPALLFCPADRPDRYAKALAAADAVILDLEDAVAPDAKAGARAALWAAAEDLDWSRVIVRVNAVTSDEFEADRELVEHLGVSTVMQAKTESPADADQLLGHDVVALLETARGVASAAAIADATNVVALMWGAEDLVASMGGTSSRHPDGTYRDVARFARAHVAVAAAAHGVAMIDAVHLDLDDVDGLRAEAVDARACGFAATACLHPRQVDVVRAAWAPTADERSWAERVLAAAEAAGGGVFAFEGRMVDEPVLRHARSLLSHPHSHPRPVTGDHA